jgi:hypothetical protein
MAETITVGGAELVPSGAASPASNGAGGPSSGSSPVPVPVPAGPTLLVVPKRVAWVPDEADDLPECRAFAEAYPGFRFKLWLNYPKPLDRAIRAGPKDVPDADERERGTRAALQQVVLEHNGWAMPDETGQPVALPPPSTDAFWETIPDELAAGMVLIVMRAPSRLPNSMIASLTASRPGSG